MTSEGAATIATYSDDKPMDIDPTPQNVTNEKYSCDICNLSFTNNCVMEAHLAGKRHQKTLRTRSVGGLVKDTSNTVDKVTGDNVITQFYCPDCGIFANSSNQLEMHIKSNKHIAKVEKNKGETNATPNLQIGLKKKANSADIKEVAPTKKTKAEGVVEVLKCTICNIELNSKIQFDQHLASNKHKNRQNPKAAPKSNKFSSAKRRGAAFMAKKREARFGLGYERPLSSSFVPGGSYLNNSQPSLFTSRNKSIFQPPNALKTKLSNYGNNRFNANSGSKFNGENFRYGRSNLNTYGQGSYGNKPLYGETNYSQNYSMNNQSTLPQYNNTQYYNAPPPPAPSKTSFSLW